MKPKPNQQTANLKLSHAVAKLAQDADIHLVRNISDATWKLPKSLAPEASLLARQRLESAAVAFDAIIKKGGSVAWVTICHPDWIREAGELDAQVIKAAVVWTRRRVQRLAKFGQTIAAGAIDVSWNDDRALSSGRFWCVHAHILMATEDLPKIEYRNLIHAEFRCRSDPRINGNGPVYVNMLKDASDIRNTLRYASGACALIDHNPKGGRHYRKRVSFGDGLSPKDKALRPARQAEFTRLMHDVGPEAFIALSGFQRRGERLNFVRSKVADRYAQLRTAEQRAADSRAAAEAAAKELTEGEASNIQAMHARILRITADYHQTKLVAARKRK